MNYQDCKVLCSLQRKDEPLVSKIPCDEYTQLAQSYFDYEFVGESKFYPYRLPKVLNEIDYRTCVICGRSGAGKSQLLKEFPFFEKKIKKYDCSKSVISNFDFTDKEDCMDRLASVGLSTVPTWCRPRNVLSVGEGFRADLALNIQSEMCFDEFTSTVDRNVAISTVIGVKKYIVKHNLKKVVFCSCHKDYIDYMEPDIVVDLDDEKVYDCRGVELKKELSCPSTRSRTTQRRKAFGKYLGNIII